MPTLTTPEKFTVGDLVAFDFPYADGGSKTRICAIVAEDPEQGEIVVAYGTSNLRLNNNPDLALTVFSQADCQAAGLHAATRFQVDRRVRVQLGDPRFKQRKSLGTAKVGQLSPGLSHRLAELYARLPPVDRLVEKQGIHPKSRSKAKNIRKRGVRFLGRRETKPREIFAA
ncbi:hypothetical protein [Tropicibacter sp. R16_0]|uniref:hypothetical protein n=1 Tax=Tropicibacter sp. R16_0 TaxID=2821102 RepID=UPI001AD96456|nr:hypothetical protein [Tropicibacter sp. R16_0]